MCLISINVFYENVLIVYAKGIFIVVLVFGEVGPYFYGIGRGVCGVVVESFGFRPNQPKEIKIDKDVVH